MRSFLLILNSKQIEHFSRNAKHDHKIEFIDDSNILSKIKMYSLSIRKFEILQIYIRENFKKNFINSNKTFYESFNFFAIKFNEQLRLCVNYRKFNVIIKRNSYSISFIEKILTRIINCSHIFKLNIIFVFNKIRMNFENEKFITFFCFFEIYKYHVMSFEFKNDFVN